MTRPARRSSGASEPGFRRPHEATSYSPFQIAERALDRRKSRAITHPLSRGATAPRQGPRCSTRPGIAMASPGSSGVEQRIENPRVGGSNPPLGTILSRLPTGSIS